MAYNVRVSVGDWACADGDRETDTYGCIWTFGEITGWFDTPGIRGSAIDKDDADGSWDAEPLLGPRIVGITGSLRTVDGPTQRAAMDRLENLLTGSDRFGTLIVDEADRGVARQASVRLNDATLWNRHSPDYAEFSLSLYAADPKRYGTDLHTATTTPYQTTSGVSFPISFPVDFGGIGSGGRLRLFNAGTLDTPVLLYLFGDLTNPRVTHVELNRTVSPRMSIAAGQAVTVDTGVPSVLLGSSSRRQVTNPAEFFLLPPGWSTLFFDADAGAGSLQVAWRDAW